jgi:phosphoribosylaminoimidazole carboxylase (NCAIR synthetase)
MALSRTARCPYFRSKCDVITYEIEHVDVRVLEELEIEEPRILVFTGHLPSHTGEP